MNREKRLVVFTCFERLWHWTQATLIVLMLVTGFEIHGTYHLWGFASALELHIVCALGLIMLWMFALFWHFTTGEWRQYAPQTRKLLTMVQYYAIGIFRGDRHPIRQTRTRKHNPLQALSYSLLILLMLPLSLVSGMMLLYNVWQNHPASFVSPETAALVHVAAAFALAIFLVVHIYMITTGKTVFHYLKAMITGYDDEIIGD